MIKFAQNDVGEQGSLTAVVRHADDEELEETTGITIDQLVSEYGLRIPSIVEQLNEEAARPRRDWRSRHSPRGRRPSMIKVLIVDDIPETRDHLSRLLGLEREIDVAGTAASGEEAIQLAMDMRPDVIVMDINMPGMDGVAASEIISQRLPNSP